MCLLSFYPEGIKPDMSRLEQGCKSNRDGFGWAIVKDPGGRNDRRLITGKSLSKDKALTAFEKARHANPGGPAMFHSRYGTSGGITVANCHPFKVAGDKRSVLAHNGVLYSMPKGDMRSDTRYFAETQIAVKGWTRFDKLSLREDMEDWLGPNNKVVVLTANPRYKQPAYLFNEDCGYWRDGEWHSNLGFVPWTPGKYAGKQYEWKLSGVACEFCKGNDVHFNYCCDCKSCQLCGQDGIDCNCYAWKGGAVKIGKTSSEVVPLSTYRTGACPSCAALSHTACTDPCTCNCRTMPASVNPAVVNSTKGLAEANT